MLISGCLTNDSNEGLSLKGTAEHGYYSSFIGYSSMDEYQISIKATNYGDSITYDAVQLYFDGGDGKGLSTLRVVEDETTSNLEKITLGFLQTDEIHTSSNGYTIDILRHSRTGKVALHVIFLNEGEVVDSFHAVLPSIIQWDGKPPDLPYGEEKSLKFTRDYDAVMEEVLKE